MQNLGIGSDRFGVLLVVRRVDECDLYPKLWQPLGEELGCAPVDVALGDDVVARFGKGEDGGRNCRHAGGKQKGGLRALQFGDRILRDGVRGIAVASIEMVRRRSPDLFFHVGDFERGGLIDRRAEGPVLFAQIHPAAHCLGLRMPFMLLHKILLSPAEP